MPTEIPYHVARVLRKYEQSLKSRIVPLVERRLKELEPGQTMTQQDISECVAAATKTLFESQPEPDPDMMERSLTDFRAGKWRTASDVIRNLQGCNT